MNLAKKSTVLLAALSVFALASCGGAKEISYKDALDWVKNHYKEEKEREIEKSTMSWDYSNNVVDGKLPDNFPLEALKGADINGIVYYLLKSSIVLVEQKEGDDPFKATKGENLVVKDMPFTSGEACYTFTESKIKDLISDEIAGHTAKFYIENNNIKYTTSFPKNLEMINVTTKCAYWFGDDGFLTKVEYNLLAENFIIPPGASADPIYLGKLDVKVTLSNPIAKA